MGTVSLSNILLTPLSIIETNGGNVMHAMKNSDSGFCGFGEAYFSTIEYGAVKAWKKHNKMTMNLVVPAGEVRFVFYTAEKNEFKIVEINSKNYARITVPPGIWFGFKGISTLQNLVLNVASIPHDPKEVERISISDIYYNWN